MLYVAENVAAISAMDPDVRRRMGMDPTAGADKPMLDVGMDPCSGGGEGGAEGHNGGFDVDTAHAQAVALRVVTRLRPGSVPGGAPPRDMAFGASATGLGMRA